MMDNTQASWVVKLCNGMEGEIVLDVSIGPVQGDLDDWAYDEELDKRKKESDELELKLLKFLVPVIQQWIDRQGPHLTSPMVPDLDAIEKNLLGT